MEWLGCVTTVTGLKCKIVRCIVSTMAFQLAIQMSYEKKLVMYMLPSADHKKHRAEVRPGRIKSDLREKN